MKHTLHCSLRRSFRWYDKWHSHPQNQHTHWLLFLVISVLIAGSLSDSIGNFYFDNEYRAQAQTALVLGISGDRLTVNGIPQFLLFVSYFDAMAASDATLDSDFAKLRSLGFNGIRMFPDWVYGANPNRLLDINGNFNPGMLSRFINILQKAQNNNLIVDVSFDRGLVAGRNAAGMINGIKNTAVAIVSYKNLYFDITNEVDHDGIACGTARFCPSEARQARNAVKAVDPQRIVSISPIYGNRREYIINGGMDFTLVHRGLSGTKALIAQAKADTPGLAVHFQEPDRCRATTCAYTANQFFTSAQDAKCAGAAGWNFHTSGGYNLGSNTMFNQFLDPTIENAVANGLNSAVTSTGWGSCSSGSPTSAPVNGKPACQVDIIFDCGLGGANTPQWVGPELHTGSYYRYPRNGSLPPLSLPPIDSVSPCPYPVPNELAVVQKYASLINANTCSETSPDFTFLDAVVIELHAKDPNWGYTGFGANSISGDTIDYWSSALASLPVITGINPNRGTNGTFVIITGKNLVATVQATGSTGKTFVSTGEVNYDGTQMNWIVPSDLPPDVYTIKVGTGILSNGVTFTLLLWNLAAIPMQTGPPEIISFEPTAVRPGQRLEIFGTNLTENVSFNSVNGEVTTIVGWVSYDRTKTVVEVPLTLKEGLYTLTVFGEVGETTSPYVLTVIVNDNSLGGASFSPTSNPPATPFGTLIQNLFTYSFYLVGLAVFVMIVWAGFLWLTAAGNSGQIAQAKQRIFSAIIGAIILLSAYLILYTINPALVGGGFVLPGLK